MSKQTAVEWLVEQIKSDQNQKALSANEWMEAIEQAKQMEKEQIEKAWWAGHDERDANHMIYPSEDCNQYYKETYAK